MNITEHFIKGSDNEITLTLTEDDVAIAVSWTSVIVNIGDLVTITRTSNVNGIDFTDGVLTITPGSLTESLSALLVGRLYQVWITVKAATLPNGAVFGAGDSTEQLYFLIEDDHE